MEVREKRGAEQWQDHSRRPMPELAEGERAGLLRSARKAASLKLDRGFEHQCHGFF